MRAGKLFGSTGIRKKSRDLKSDYYIIGLGNPGAQYEHTRHNAGFDVISILAQRHNITTRIFAYKARLGSGIIKDKRVTLAMPQTYMNNSGESVREMGDALHIRQEQLILVYDDIDLKTGAVRIKTRGSAGTHNGMKSVVYQLQTDEIIRVRVGIGKPEGELVDYVLGEHTDKQTAFETLSKAADAIETILAEGVDEAQSRFN